MIQESAFIIDTSFNNHFEKKFFMDKFCKIIFLTCLFFFLQGLSVFDALATSPKGKCSPAEARAIGDLIHSRADRLKTWESFPKISETALSDRQELLGEGGGFLRIEKATMTIEGTERDVFVKISRARVGVSADDTSLAAGFRLTQSRTLSDVENEVRFFKVFSEAGFAPEVRGVTTIDGHYAVVTDFVRGVHFDPKDRQLPANFFISRFGVDDMRKIKSFCLEKQIDPIDIQFRVTPEGRVFIIDPELFTFVGPAHMKEHAKLMDDVFDPIIKRLARYAK